MVKLTAIILCIILSTTGFISCGSTKRQEASYNELSKKVQMFFSLKASAFSYNELKNNSDTLKGTITFKNISADTIYILDKPKLTIDKKDFWDMDSTSHYTMDDYYIIITDYENHQPIRLDPNSAKSVPIDLTPAIKYFLSDLSIYSFKILYVNNKIAEWNGQKILLGSILSNKITFKNVK